MYILTSVALSVEIGLSGVPASTPFGFGSGDDYELPVSRTGRIGFFIFLYAVPKSTS